MKSEEDGVERSGAVLEGSGDDIHHILKHMRESGQELPQGTLQGRIPLS